jgi:hypothetical protein
MKSCVCESYVTVRGNSRRTSDDKASYPDHISLQAAFRECCLAAFGLTRAPSVGSFTEPSTFGDRVLLRELISHKAMRTQE